MIRYGGGILLLLALSGCLRNEKGTPGTTMPKGSSYSKYATRFDVEQYGEFKLLKVFDPWQGSRGVTYTYVLGSEKEQVPDSLAGHPFFRTPVSRVVTLSTTHVAMISKLGMAGTIKGASGTGFIFDPEMAERCTDGQVKEVGYDQGLNYETIISLEPEVVFMFGVEGSVTATSEKLEELGLSVVYCAEYLEDHPLGKAEWIRFFALFYGLEEESSREFRRIDSTYQGLVKMAAEAEHRPSVIIGLPWKDTWYVSGGRSYAAQLISDAGGDYLWKDDLSAEAVPLDLESVFARAVNAEVWINPGAAGSLDELIHYDSRFGQLDVVSHGSVFNNNARMSRGGGNDYWESGTVRPELVLTDLIRIFHPDLLPDHPLYYYIKLK